MSRHSGLAERVGTPLYVYDLDRLEAARRDLFAALPDGFDVFYALKANPHPEIARALREGDGPACRAEVSSAGELSAALEAGFPADECLYTGPGKTGPELRGAIARGVRLFSVESLGDLRHIGAAATAAKVVTRCLLRINSAHAEATSSIRMTGVPTQFGIDAETLPDVLPRLREVAGTRIVGAHFFPLSNAADEDSLIAAFENTLAVAAGLRRDHGLPLELLDIGGGFAVPYGTPGRRAAYPKLKSALRDALDRHFPDPTDRPRLACESGRYLVGDSGSLHCSVVNIKESRGRTFVILDAGINTFGGMSGLGRLLPVAVEPQSQDGDDPAGPPRPAAQTASLVGPLCTPGDVLGRRVELPDLAEGDLVTVPNAGAYGPTASLLGFLGRPAPAEALVRGEELVSLTRLEQRRVDESGPL
ncbi:type III PLP-dependent enzyme [Streptomyces sp. PA5.6]|uniref:type III PLP-dependent enzyme n=1 Tax=Streptomyces sp. PA5.6 TaxID=3035651 RepID=UPI003904B356